MTSSCSSGGFPGNQGHSKIRCLILQQHCSRKTEVPLLSLAQAIPCSPRIRGASLVMVALNNTIPFSLIIWRQTQSDSGLASFLNATTAMFAAAAPRRLLKDEPLTKNKKSGFFPHIHRTLAEGPFHLEGSTGFQTMRPLTSAHEGTRIWSVSHPITH